MTKLINEAIKFNAEGINTLCGRGSTIKIFAVKLACNLETHRQV